MSFSCPMADIAQQILADIGRLLNIPPRRWKLLQAEITISADGEIAVARGASNPECSAARENQRTGIAQLRERDFEVGRKPVWVSQLRYESAGSVSDGAVTGALCGPSAKRCCFTARDGTQS